MSKICGHCYRKFPGLYTPHLIWCKEEKIYVCRRCWEDVCGEGHGKGDKNKGWNPRDTLLIVTLIMSMFWPFFIVGAIDVYYIEQWNELEVTDISELPDNGWVKIQGTLVGESNSTSISGHKEKDRYGYDWIFDDDIEFILEDNTGNITISTERYYLIMDGPHDVNATKYFIGSEYRGGDNVTAVCEVVNDGETEAIYLLWLGTKNTEIPEPFWGYFGVYSVLILNLIIYLYLGVKIFRQNSHHKKKVEFQNPITIQETDMLKPTGLNWLINSEPTKKRSRLSWVIFFIILDVLILILIHFLFQWFFHTQEDYMGFSYVGMFVIPFFNILPFGFLAQKDPGAPNEIAVSEKGIHFYYYDHIVRYLRDDHIGWDEIKDIRLKKKGKYSYWVIEKKNNTEEQINWLIEENRNVIVSEWKNRKK